MGRKEERVKSEHDCLLNPELIFAPVTAVT